MQNLNEKRMNKQELIELIDSLKISKNEFYVVSSGALVLRNILPDAGDLDISVTDKGLKQLKEHFELIPKNDDNWYIVNDKVECVCNGDFGTGDKTPENCDGIFVQNIREYYSYLLESEREKDKKRIPLVQKYIKENYTDFEL